MFGKVNPLLLTVLTFIGVWAALAVVSVPLHGLDGLLTMSLVGGAVMLIGLASQVVSRLALGRDNTPALRMLLGVAARTLCFGGCLFVVLSSASEVMEYETKRMVASYAVPFYLALLWVEVYSTSAVGLASGLANGNSGAVGRTHPTKSRRSFSFS